MKLGNFVLLAIIFFFGVLSCKKEKKEEAHKKSFDRVGMLAYLADNVIHKVHSDLVLHANQLHQLSNDFCALPTENNLLNLRTKWKETVGVWKKCETYAFGKVHNTFISSKIDSWPSRTEVIDKVIMDSVPITDSIFKQLAVVTKGFPGMEYLIFSKIDGNEPVLDSFNTGLFAENRKSYLMLLAKELDENINFLFKIWAKGSGNYLTEFAQTDGTDVKSSLSLLVNSVIKRLENTVLKRLAVPLGNNNNGVSEPERVEAPLSHISLVHIKNIVESIQEVMVGVEGEGVKKLVLKSHLDACEATYENELLSKKVLNQIGLIEVDMEAISMPLYLAVTEEKTKVEALKESIRQLLILFKVDVASQLSVAVTFSDNDGD